MELRAPHCSRCLAWARMPVRVCKPRIPNKYTTHMFQYYVATTRTRSRNKTCICMRLRVGCFVRQFGICFVCVCVLRWLYCGCDYFTEVAKRTDAMYFSCKTSSKEVNRPACQTERYPYVVPQTKRQSIGHTMGNAVRLLQNDSKTIQKRFKHYMR
jgi:hypothetical protein